MIIAGDLYTYLDKFDLTPLERKEIIETFFNWMTSDDVLHRLASEIGDDNFPLSTYIIAMDHLKGTQV